MKCPFCGNEIDFFEEDDYNEGAPSTRYACKECGIFVDIQRIKDKEILDAIGYEGEEEEGD